MAEDKKILITAALPYVNNVVHLGNIIGCVLSADCYARHCRKRSKQVLYVGGTDEYGTATEMAARKEGMTPRELCNKNFEIHKKIYEWFNISFDCFGRTSTDIPGDKTWPQTEITWDIYKKMVDNGYVRPKTETCLYCEEIDSFVSDRFVTGTCYLCGYDDANGDQCDKCGKLLDAIKLIYPKYKLNTSYPLVKRETTHLYFDLPKLQPQLESLLKDHGDSWSNNARAITTTFLRDGLKERNITRDLKWGTPVPDTEIFGSDFSQKVFYVWFDAPIGYLSITKNAIGDDYVKWWKDPENTELVQFMAKDNVQFHSVIFPATLKATDDDYTTVSRISSVDYLQYGNSKFSKSRKTGVFGDDVMKLDYPADYWRFYLLSIRPESKDSKFTWSGFMDSINNDLFANFGNLVSRVINISFKAHKKLKINNVKKIIDFDEDQIDYLDKLIVAVKRADEALDDIKICESIRLSSSASSVLNDYITKFEIWNILKCDDVKIIETTIYYLNYMLWNITQLYSSYVPGICNKIFEIQGQLGEDKDTAKFSIPTSKPPQLFKLIKSEDIETLIEKFGSTD
jgi:methionyl-tRNA synthetase